MLRKPVLILAIAILTFGACSRDHGSAQAHNPYGATRNAGVGPSSVAAAICGAEAKREIAQSVGFDTLEALKPTWTEARRVYACDYVYSGGAKMAVSIQEASNANATTAYFDLVAHRLNNTRPLFGFTDAAAAYVTSDGSVVVRRDDTVLLIDVSMLPPRFGRAPGSTREDIAETVATIIVGSKGAAGLVG